jgi:proteasome component ECM29
LFVLFQVNHDAAYAKTGLVQELSRRLNELQSSFISLLSDPKSKKMCRESCCLGLAACHSLAKLSDTGNEINEKLLRAFGQTTNYGISVMQETQEQANRRRTEEGRLNNQGGAEPTDEEMGVQPEVGGSAGMSEAALGAYREMAAAAVSLGRPGVLYALFMLSVTHSAWFSKGGRERYGPSALLGENSIIGSRTNTAELRVALRPHLGKIIPRLLRASHDPNKQTREQIKNLWDGLTGGGAEARGLITQHLLSIVDSLITDTTHKLWRARVGATGALAQVIVGRSWSELGGVS